MSLVEKERYLACHFTYTLIDYTHQDVLSVHADDTEKNRQRRRQQQSGILKSVSQREDPRTNVTLEQMHHGFQVPAVVQSSISAFDLLSTRDIFSDRFAGK